MVADPRSISTDGHKSEGCRRESERTGLTANHVDHADRETTEEPFRVLGVFRGDKAFWEVANGDGLGYNRFSQGRATMAGQFQYNVFLSHSSKDKPVVREIAGWLREVRLRLRFDEWELPVASVYDRQGKDRRSQSAATAKIEEAPFHLRFRNSEFGFTQPGMSAQAFGSDWAQLACPAVASERRRKAGACGRCNRWERRLAVRDPLNRERRSPSGLRPSTFAPRPSIDAPIKGSLAQFLYINWRALFHPDNDNHYYAYVRQPFQYCIETL